VVVYYLITKPEQDIDIIYIYIYICIYMLSNGFYYFFKYL